MKVMRVFGLLLMVLLLVTMATLPAYASTLPQTVDFEGIVRKTALMEDGTGWIKVDGRVVLITPDTDVDGMLDVGALVEVTAETHHGKYIGLDVKVVDEITIEGFVLKLDLEMGKLLVDHTKVFIDEETDVDEDLALYVLVRVRGSTHMGGLLATDIDVIDEIYFFGFINKLDLEMGKLLVDGRLIRINADTEIDGMLEKGAFITGKAIVDMGKVTGTEIRVFEPE